ncbi:MAG: hypothetical protein JWN78_1295 [Bacteroidota bacterium]|nr:hypothetical protein [Bacteroidota bacterium]
MQQINFGLLREYKHECESTRKLLASVPFDHPDWKPHEKSMTLSQLAIHIADLPNWVAITLERDGLDWAKEPYKPKVATSTEELLKIHDDAVESAIKSLSVATDEKFMENWTMRNGDKVYFTMPKIACLRASAFNHIYHHRGQLTVYLRLLNVPVPGMYGPTADFEM